jgi:tetratricopeptide (TPR) repeat protein
MQRCSRPLILLLTCLVLPAHAAQDDGLDSVPMPQLREAMRDWDALAQAWFRLKVGDADGARQDATRLLRGRPGDPDALHLLGIAATAAGKPQQAQGALQRSLRRRADGWVGLHLVNLLLDRGRLSAAERVVTDLEGRIPTDLQVRRARVYLLTAQDRLDEARAALEAAEAERPTPELAHQLAVLLEAMGNLGEAAAAARRAVERDGDSGEWRRHLFALLVATGAWDELVQRSSEAGASSAGGGLDAYYKGLALARLDRPAEAIKALSAVEAHGQPDAFAIAGSAGWLLQLGAFEPAERAARRALVTRADDPALHHLLAMVLSRLGRESEGLAHYRRAADGRADDAAYRFDLLVSLCALERADELEAALARAARDFDEDPRFPELAERCLDTGS